MPRFDKDYYKLLGLGETASPEEIRKVYRSKAKECHPDRAGGDKAKEARFKEINEAHEVLSDPRKRAQYDQMRRSGFSGDSSGFFRQGGPGAAGGPSGHVHDMGDLGDLGDLFSSFVDMDAWGRQAGGRSRRQRGEDTGFSLEIPFDLAARGGRTTITLPKEEHCRTCGGTGAKDAAKPCARCRGTGVASRAQGGFAFNRPCPACMGRGVQPGPACPACGGEGTRHVERQVEVRIPAGVSTGSTLRLAGEGRVGSNGAPAGDCLLELTVAPHADFDREGRDVTGTVEIDFADAILGAEVTARTLGGSVTLKIPPGTQPGARLRLAGQGIQGPDGEPGDHYVRIKVRVPRKITEEQRKALEAFKCSVRS